MNINEVIKNYPEGCTIRRNKDGGLIAMNGKETREYFKARGYIVSVYSDSLYVGKEYESHNETTFQWVQKSVHLPRARYYGIFPMSPGIYSIDVNIVVSSYLHAQILGQTFLQEYIWDIHNEKAIMVDYRL